MPQPRQTRAKKTTSGSRSRSASSSRSASAKETAGVREQLARYLDPREVVVLTRDRLQEAVDDAVERGRMTRHDATALVTALFERGKTQTDDLISQIEGLVTGTPTRIVREVDRARRATGIGSNFPVSGYDDLTAAEVGERLNDLSPPELRKVRDYERRNANRKSVLQNIERKLG
jgi:polyhydroxyalkanoate synthesis regulator phasin